MTAALPRTTEAERLVIQRIGQDVFRDVLNDYSGSRCPLTGITEPGLLRASHIIPWADCTDEQRLDVHNGLLLSACGTPRLIADLSVLPMTASVLESPQLSAMARRALDLGNLSPLSGLRDAHRVNLALHRAANGFHERAAIVPPWKRPLSDPNCSAFVRPHDEVFDLKEAVQTKIPIGHTFSSEVERKRVRRHGWSHLREKLPMRNLARWRAFNQHSQDIK